MLKTLRNKLLALHKDEGGADMVEYVLIIAIIALPLLAFVLWYWKDIKAWVEGRWTQIKGDTP